MEAFKSLVICNLTSEIFRFLALFITYAYHKPTSSTSRTPKIATGTLPGRSGSNSQGPKRPSINTILDVKDIVSPTTMTKRQIGNKVLEMYSDLLCDKGNTANIRKFAKTVTNKVCSPTAGKREPLSYDNQWLLHLLTEDDPEVVVHGTKILARLLVVHGSGYVTKFAGKTGGFAIMRFRLRRWWDLPTLWPICFCILFGRDVAEIDMERSFELFSLLEPFSNCKIVYPGVLPVIMSMLQHGLKEVMHHQDDPDSPLTDRGNGQDPPKATLSVPAGANRRRSMSLTKELEARRKFPSRNDNSNLLTSSRNAPAQERAPRWSGYCLAHCHSLLCRSAFKVVRL